LINPGIEGIPLTIMTTLETDILESLNELEEAVAQLASKQGQPNLMGIFEKIDQQTAMLPRDTDPSLLHYLHKKSYEKARLFLMGRDAENAQGNCHGHRH
jgi:hypothetical protein